MRGSNPAFREAFMDAEGLSVGGRWSGVRGRLRWNRFSGFPSFDRDIRGLPIDWDMSSNRLLKNPPFKRHDTKGARWNSRAQIVGKRVQ